MNAKEIGAIGVLAVAKKLAEKGIKVAFPFGDSARYDLLLELNGRFARVQVKSTQNKDGLLRVKLMTIITKYYNDSRPNFVLKHYLPGEIEAFIIYNRSNDSLYILPPRMLRQQDISLRLDSLKSKQRKGIHWATDYENALGNIKWKS